MALDERRLRWNIQLDGAIKGTKRGERVTGQKALAKEERKRITKVNKGAEKTMSQVNFLIRPDVDESITSGLAASLNSTS